MGKLTSTLIVDGTELEEGSVEAVKLYDTLLRDADEKLMEASRVAACIPTEVQNEWRSALHRIEIALHRHSGKVGRFEQDFRARGLASAIEDAKFRKELT